MRFQAHGFIECPGSGIEFPNVKGDIMAAILFRKSPGVFIKRAAYVGPALCLIYAKIVYIKGGQWHQAAAVLMAECTKQIAQHSPAVIVYEYGGIWIIENGKEFG